MEIKELYEYLCDDFKVEKEKSFKLQENPYNNLKNNKVDVTEYSVDGEIFYIDNDNKVYKLIVNSFTHNLAEQVGYFDKKTIFLYKTIKKN